MKGIDFTTIEQYLANTGAVTLSYATTWIVEPQQVEVTEEATPKKLSHKQLSRLTQAERTAYFRSISRRGRNKK